MWQLRTGNLELIFIKKAVLSSRFSVLSNGFAENLMYIEFHARSAFSFLEGASLPESLIETCANLGMPAMALLDRDGVYGAPRFYMAAKDRKSTRLNSSHANSSYAVFCLKKKK